MKSNDILIEMNTKLTKIDNRIQRITNPSKWITIKEAVEYSSTSESTLRRNVVKGTLKCSKRIGKNLFRRSEIDRWLDGK